MIRPALCALTGLAAGSMAADAGVIDGAIVAQSGDGQFVLILDDLPLAVGEDTFNDDNLYAFNEAQGIALGGPVRVDIGAGGARIIPAGRVVASHYVFFDGSGGRQRGYVTFDAPILGVAAQADTMGATDTLAGTDVLYIQTELRGLEDGDRAWIDPGNPNRLWVDWAGSSPGDYLRVFTEPQPMM